MGQPTGFWDASFLCRNEGLPTVAPQIHACQTRLKELRWIDECGIVHTDQFKWQTKGGRKKASEMQIQGSLTSPELTGKLMVEGHVESRSRLGPFHALLEIRLNNHCS
jgi:hypothetical protein